KRGQRPADEGGQDEEPHLRQRGPLHDQRRPQAAGRVDRGAGEGMPTRWTAVRAIPIANPPKPGDPRRLVAPSTARTKTNVSTASAAKALVALRWMIDALPKPSA